MPMLSDYSAWSPKFVEILQISNKYVKYLQYSFEIRKTDNSDS